jgi:hypothetical protein
MNIVSGSNKKGFVFFLILSCFLVITCTCSARQKGDETFEPVVAASVYETGKGPAVYIDEAHHNFHTLNGRYQAFARVLQKDGYRLFAFKSKFSKETLEKVDILVISNPLHQRNVKDWSLPTPSAFSKEEIDAIEEWINKGGALFLIADHMPIPGAAMDLAARFGFKFHNGFAMKKGTKRGQATFTVKQGLQINKITRGRTPGEKIDHVVTFTGQAFKIPGSAEPVLVFNSDYIVLLPQKAWEFSDDTPQIEAEGLSQGAVLEYGQGRMAVFGEAAMFTSQTAGPGKNRFGMSAPEADQNQQFLLNIIHWLDGIIK